MTIIQPTCSHKPRPSVQNSRSYFLRTGASAWGRDVYHAQKSGITTACGRDCSEWLRMDPRPLADALADKDFCARCAKVLQR